MKRNKSVLTIALTSFSVLVFGVESFAQVTTATTATTITATTQTTPVSTTAGSTYVLPDSGGNAADSGRSAQNMQLITAAVNVGAAGMYVGICAQPHGAGSWACPLAGLASAAAGLLGLASDGSGAAGGAMSAYDPKLYQYGVPPGTVDENGNPITYGTGPDGTGGIHTQGTGGKLPDGTTPATIAGAVAKIRGDLEKSGVTISPDGRTMTTKDGRKFDLSKGGDGSPSGLQAMGLTAAEAGMASEAGKKYAAATNAKYAGMIAKLGAEGGGGGAGGRAPASDGAGGGMSRYNGWAKDPFAKNRPKPKLSGLTRKLGDDTIGVAGDDIFEMITRRYKARDQVNQFLKD